MYAFADHQITSESALEAFLMTLAAESRTSRTAVVAGHFMLAYSPLSDELVPMVWQDLSEPALQDFSKRMVGDFPMRTFQYGVDVWEASDGAADLVLLVNDHKFQSPSFQPALRNHLRGRGGALRRDFYRDHGSTLPDSFSTHLTQRGLSASDLLRVAEHEGTTLPLDGASIYTSEQVLRNRFDDKTRARLLEDSAFSSDGRPGAKSQIYYSPSYAANQICLTKDGSCDCSGEVLELYRDLAAKGYERVVLFSPDECSDPVNVGTEAGLYVLSLQGDYLRDVTIIWGLGGMAAQPSSPSTQDPVYVRRHEWSPPI